MILWSRYEWCEEWRRNQCMKASQSTKFSAILWCNRCFAINVKMELRYNRYLQGLFRWAGMPHHDLHLCKRNEYAIQLFGWSQNLIFWERGLKFMCLIGHIISYHIAKSRGLFSIISKNGQIHIGVMVWKLRCWIWMSEGWMSFFLHDFQTVL
jgi:hypothetical protein